MAKTIVAVGGGQINNRDANSDTVEIDREIVRMSMTSPPRLLFVPTASADNQEHILDVGAHFGRLGCEVHAMETVRSQPSRAEMKSSILSSSIIYVGGGDSHVLMRKWADLDLGPLFVEAWKRGVVLSGLSAGAMCWFAFRPSAGQPGVPHIVARHGLALLEASVCPHYDSQPQLREQFWENLPPRRIGVGLDDCAAIRIRDSAYDIIISRAGARVHLCMWDGHRRVERPLLHGQTGSIDEFVHR